MIYSLADIMIYPNTTTTPVAEPFEQAVGRVVQRLKEVLIELLSCTVGEGANTVDIQRELGLDKKLAWQVFRLATGEDLVAETANLPGKRSFVRLLAAFRERSVSEKLVERLENEYEHFDRLVAEHAGDRSFLDAMIAGLSPERSEALSTKVRKSLSELQAQVWGYRAKVGHTCLIYHPRTSDSIESCRVDGVSGLCKLRRDVSIRLQVCSSTSLSDALSGHSAAPTTPAGNTLAPVLLTDFCRGIQLAPSVETWKTQGKQIAITCTNLGRSSLADVATLTRTTAISITEPVDESWYQSNSQVGMPGDVSYRDLLFPAGWTNTATGRVRTFFAGSNPENVWQKYPDDLLPMRETVVYRGRVRPTVGAGIPAIAEAPRYQELIKAVVTNLGWTETEFDLYRCRIEYPIPHSLIELVVDGSRMKR